jgi:hypothetical protein
VTAKIIKIIDAKKIKIAHPADKEYEAIRLPAINTIANVI